MSRLRLKTTLSASFSNHRTSDVFGAVIRCPPIVWEPESCVAGPGSVATRAGRDEDEVRRGRGAALERWPDAADQRPRARRGQLADERVEREERRADGVAC